MRQSRLLSILLLLQNRGRLTGKALAEEFEVSIRTIYRDVDELSAAGVPVYADRGPNGGFQLLDGYRTRLTGLTLQEAETLFLAGLPGPVAALGLGDAMEVAQLKLLAALPDASRQGAEKVQARVHLDPLAWFRSPEETAQLPIIADAVWKQRRLRILYNGGSREVERLLEPLGLVLKAGIWYVVAQVQGSLRTYRFANLRTITPLDENFERPNDFDLARYWTSWAARYEASLYQLQVRIRLSPRGLSQIRSFSAALAEATRDPGPPDRDGWFTVTVPAETPEQAMQDMLRLGLDAELLEPADLRAQVREAAASIASRYGALR